MSDNPYQSTGQPEYPPPPPADSSAVSGIVKPPAIALIVVGVVNTLLSLWGVARSAMNMMGGAAMAAQKDQLINQWREAGMNEDQIQQLAPLIEFLMGPAGLILNGIGLVFGIVILLGGVRMKELTNRGFALTASIMAMIPCISQCCLIGLPIGIWALVVLNRDDVKRSFR